MAEDGSKEQIGARGVRSSKVALLICPLLGLAWPLCRHGSFAASCDRPLDRGERRIVAALSAWSPTAGPRSAHRSSRTRTKGPGANYRVG